MTVLLTCTLNASSQSDDYSMQFNRSAVPSGTSSFQNTGASVSPSLYTGGLTLSLPIYTLKGSDLQIPISIAYTAANGVRPSDPNTVVGMDWTLMAGGSISRTVRGLPDESAYGYIGTHLEGVAVVNDFNSPNTTATLNFNSHYRSGQPPLDGEPDLFNLSTPYFSVQFTLDQNGQPVFSGGSTGLKINHQLYDNTLVAEQTGFTVIDPQGTQYIFGMQPGGRELTTTTFFGTSMQYVSTWYLEKIITLNSKDVVNFTYQMGQDETIYTYECNKQYTSAFASAGFPNNPPTGSSGVQALGSTIATIAYNGPLFVKTITTKLGEADFTYTPISDPYNQCNPPLLTAITIKELDPISNANSTVLQTYNFSYSEVYDAVVPPSPPPLVLNALYWIYYRRTLNTITVTGNTSATSAPLTLYSLKYYQGQELASRATPQYCDYWGYQNNVNKIFVDIDNDDQYYFTNPDGTRQPASFVPTGSTQPVPMAANFALQELDQLGGSKTVFNYQQNDYYNGSANVAAGGTRVSSIVRTLPTGESLTTSYSYNDAGGHSTGQLWSDLYRHVLLYTTNLCCNVTTDAVSTSPYGISDDMGVMLGYSSVKVTEPNGGYTISNFSNFSDYPDIIPTQSFFGFLNYSAAYQFSVSEQLSSFSYKRGRLLSNAIYKANGDMISQDVNTYGTVDPGSPPPVIKAIGIQEMTWFITTAVYAGVNIYHSNIEDWRLQQTVHKDYDQQNPLQSLQTTTVYAYAADNRQVHSISTTDSKGQSYVKTFYYANDAGIPMVTSSEQTAINGLVAANAVGVVIHQTENRNGTIRQLHNSFTSVPVNTIAGIYLTSSSTYAASTLIRQQQFSYDASSSQLTTFSDAGGKPTAISYAYNLSYPVVSVVNAVNTQTLVNQIVPNQGQLSMMANNNAFQQQLFTTYAPGTITVALPVFFESGAYCSFFITLTGATSGTVDGSICSRSDGGTCNDPISIDFTNRPADTYTINVSPDMNIESTNDPISVSYTYNGIYASPTGYNEYFFEGFEENTASTAGTAHSGNRYWNGGYGVSFTPPNSRSYQVQWWSLSGGKWVFHQQAYTQGMLLSGPVDDVRVFPSDALMTTFTYNPLVGKTSETDPAGRTTTYEYDGLGRIAYVRDQDGNILKQYDYQYQVGLQQ
jgi:YD repeat-containing protein